MFNDYLAVQDRGAGNIPGHMLASRDHTNEMAPLCAVGPGAEMFAEFAMTDQKAAELWGAQYGWDGAFIDNTSVFHLMHTALAPSSAMAVQ